VKDGVRRILLDFADELCKTFTFRLKGDVLHKGRAEVDLVQGPNARCVFDDAGIIG
jgi:hypothetical protein